MLQRQLDVDILITGHTHQFKVGTHRCVDYTSPSEPISVCLTSASILCPFLIYKSSDSGQRQFQRPLCF